jgi:cadmium resistance protein CadD (predicted permease)
MRKFRLIIIYISIALILVALFIIDYQDFISKANIGAFFGIIAMLLNVFSMILSNKHEAKNKMQRKPNSEKIS